MAIKKSKWVFIDDLKQKEFMKLKLQKSLRIWSEESNYHYFGTVSDNDCDILSKSASLQQLRAYGYETSALVSAASFYGNELESSFSYATDLRVLCWHWSNGDKIIFPINSADSIYIGNTPQFWFDYYPFMRKIEDGIYDCSLRLHGAIYSRHEHNHSSPVYIGGQTHFGHFITDKFAHLCSLAELAASIDFSSFIIASGHQGVVKELIHFLWYLYKGKMPVNNLQDQTEPSLVKLPACNGIFTVGPCWIPSDNHRPDCLLIANNTLYSSGLLDQDNSPLKEKHQIMKPNVAYISRMTPEEQFHDRISNYEELKSMLARLGVDHIFPSILSLQQRLCLLSKYDFVISDSGSCCLNGVLFARPDAKVYQIQGKRLLSDSSELAMSQVYKSLPLIGSRLFSVLGEPRLNSSSSNSWYDMIQIDLDAIQRIAQH